MRDWKIKQVEELAIVERGKFSARPRNDPQYYDGNIPFIQTGDVKNCNGKIYNYSQTLNSAGLNVSKLFPKNSLVITIAANIGDVARVNFDFACPDSLVVLQPFAEVNPIWLQYILSSKKSYFESRATQNAQANINLQVIRPLKINTPPLKEQKAIADTLQTWDTAIEKTEALIAAKKMMFKNMLYILFHKNINNSINLKNLVSDDVIIEKGTPLIKKDTEVGAYPVIAGGKTSPYSHSKYTHSLPCITISASGAYAGYVWYHDYPIWASDCNVLYTKTHSTQYLYYALKSKQAQIYALQSGGAQPHIYAKDIKKISVPYPPLQEQKTIAEVLSAAQQEITLLKQLVEKYRTQKQGLMQKLLTGEWRLDI